MNVSIFKVKILQDLAFAEIDTIFPQGHIFKNIHKLYIF
jgi:hypothetical protein